jgi:hypothetical protein
MREFWTGSEGFMDGAGCETAAWKVLIQFRHVERQHGAHPTAALKALDPRAKLRQNSIVPGTWHALPQSFGKKAISY